MQFVKGSEDKKLRLSADNLHVIKWFVYASFAVHLGFKSHTRAVMTMGCGVIQLCLSKQKLNKQSSCKAELVAVDDVATKVLWTKQFLEQQGYKIEQNILYQDNKSTILLLTNEKRSSRKRTHALNIRYFFMHNQQQKGNVSIAYCLTRKMTGDFMTKPKNGQAYRKFSDDIMGVT